MPSRQLALLVEPMCPTPTRGSTAWLRGRPCMPRIIGDRILLNPTPSNAPADKFAGEEVNHGGQVQPTLAGGHAGEFGKASLVGHLGGEIAAEAVGTIGWPWWRHRSCVCTGVRPKDPDRAHHPNRPNPPMLIDEPNRSREAMRRRAGLLRGAPAPHLPPACGAG